MIEFSGILESQVMYLWIYSLPLEILDHQEEGMHVAKYLLHNLVTYLFYLCNQRVVRT